VRRGWGGALTFRGAVAERGLAHIRQLHRPFAAAVHEQVAMQGVEFGRSDDLRELFHIGWLYINDIWGGVRTTLGTY
jgi:hypothetical protein